MCPDGTLTVNKISAFVCLARYRSVPTKLLDSSSLFCAVWSFKFKSAGVLEGLHWSIGNRSSIVSMKRSWWTVSLPSSRLIHWPRNKYILPLSSMWNVTSSALFTSAITVMLLDATMMSSTQTKMKVWPFVSAVESKQWSFLLPVNPCLSRKFASSLYQLLAACFKQQNDFFKSAY